MITIKNTQSEEVKNSSILWKPVRGYEGLYEVSNTGLIKSVQRTIIMRNGQSRFITEKIWSGYKNPDGYMTVTLSKEGKCKTYGVHVLVGHAFVEGYDPETAYEINHKDNNPANNNSENLEWCDRKYNLRYGDYQSKMSIANGGTGSVKAYDLDGNFIGEWPSIKEASKATGVEISSISYNLRGLINAGHTHGLRFTA